jgi:acetyltransferase-like isoleucine patch superfamily enzyme
MRRIEHDWLDRPLPDNLVLGENAYLESSHCFRQFFSTQSPGLVMDEASGLYQFNSAFIAGPNAVIHVGAYSCLNDCKIVAKERVEIGSYCLIAWGVIITDWLAPKAHGAPERASIMRDVARTEERHSSLIARAAPVVIEDNVWIGFDSVVCGGVTIGRGAVVGCKTMIDSDVPPYAVVAGQPPRIIRYLDPDDTGDCRLAALHEFGRAPSTGRM